MHPDICPCCYSETYKSSDGRNPFEQTTGFCETCGFAYAGHVDRPIREQVLEQRAKLKELNILYLDWDEIEKCDTVLGFCEE